MNSNNINWPLLREAVSIVMGVPEGRIDLRWIARGLQGEGEHGCGTVACAIGWIGLHPKFQDLGVKSLSQFSMQVNGVTESYSAAAFRLFGLSTQESGELFAPAGYSRLDQGIWEPHLSDKRRFQRRVVKFFEKHGQPIDPKFRKEAGL